MYETQVHVRVEFFTGWQHLTQINRLMFPEYYSLSPNLWVSE